MNSQIAKRLDKVLIVLLVPPGHTHEDDIDDDDDDDPRVKYLELWNPQKIHWFRKKVKHRQKPNK